MTWPPREHSYKRLSKGEVGKTSGGDQRNLTAKASIADIAAEVMIGKNVMMS
jgi:hypothetical protein